MERESPKKKKGWKKVEGAERKDDRRYGGEGREIQKEVKGLGEGGGGISSDTEVDTQRGGAGRGWGHGRVAEWGPSRAQAGPDRATKGRFLPLTSLLKVPSGFLAARWCASSPTSTPRRDRLRSHPRHTAPPLYSVLISMYLTFIDSAPHTSALRPSSPPRPLPPHPARSTPPSTTAPSSEKFFHFASSPLIRFEGCSRAVKRAFSLVLVSYRFFYDDRHDSSASFETLRFLLHGFYTFHLNLAGLGTASISFPSLSFGKEGRRKIDGEDFSSFSKIDFEKFVIARPKNFAFVPFECCLRLQILSSTKFFVGSPIQENRSIHESYFYLRTRGMKVARFCDASGRTTFVDSIEEEKREKKILFDVKK